MTMNAGMHHRTRRRGVPMYSAQNTDLDPTEPHQDPSVLPTAAAGAPDSADLDEPSPLVPSTAPDS